jgi:hypothetical protein
MTLPDVYAQLVKHLIQQRTDVYVLVQTRNNLQFPDHSLAVHAHQQLPLMLIIQLNVTAQLVNHSVLPKTNAYAQ